MSTVLTGNMNFLTLGDILQLIGSQGGTGVLRIKCKYAPEPGLVYFQTGNIISASTGKSAGIDTLYSFFGWTEADFEFSREDFKMKRIINETRMAIIMDGLRMVDDGSVKQLGPVAVEETTTVKKINLPAIKGDPVDYIYVAAEEEFSENQVIVHEKTHGDWMWAILEGTVDIFKETPKGPLNILRMGEGCFIGSIDSFLFKNNVRITTAIAASNVQLGVLNVQRLSREFAALSPEMKRVIIGLDRRLRQVTEKAVQLSVKKKDIKQYVKGKKAVIKQGKTEKKNFLIITGGDVVIVKHKKNDHILLASLGENDFIGKLPFPDMDIGHEPGFASVYASEDFKVRKLNTEKLVKEYTVMPPMIKSFIKNIADRITSISKMMCLFQK
ncbi:MAG: DUF4388 domain-containing protein [Desulfobacterales bacterium]|nr:DUF4388 domain-containing protein [Desulfobacterales bacterium]